MSRARWLPLLLHLCLALCLGLGPLGAAELARWMHGSVCGWNGCACDGCGAGSSASCCTSGAPEREGPSVSADEGCPCALARPEESSAPALAPRTCEARASWRGVLERSPELAWSPRDSRTSPAEPAPRMGHPPGPPGARARHGGARAAGLGGLRI
jgi:hypothetical protein